MIETKQYTNLEQVIPQGKLVKVKLIKIGKEYSSEYWKSKQVTFDYQGKTYGTFVKQKAPIYDKLKSGMTFLAEGGTYMDKAYITWHEDPSCDLDMFLESVGTNLTKPTSSQWNNVVQSPAEYLFSFAEKDLAIMAQVLLKIHWKIDDESIDYCIKQANYLVTAIKSNK